MKLTERQTRKLRQLSFGRGDPRFNDLAPRSLAQQLARKGLVLIDGSWTRYEWNRRVATRTKIHLTPAGIALCSELFDKPQATKEAGNE